MKIKLYYFIRKVKKKKIVKEKNNSRKKNFMSQERDLKRIIKSLMYFIKYITAALTFLCSIYFQKYLLHFFFYEIYF